MSLKKKPLRKLITLYQSVSGKRVMLFFLIYKIAPTLVGKDNENHMELSPHCVISRLNISKL